MKTSRWHLGFSSFSTVFQSYSDFELFNVDFCAYSNKKPEDQWSGELKNIHVCKLTYLHMGNKIRCSLCVP